MRNTSRHAYALFGISAGLIGWVSVTASKSHALPFVLMLGMLLACVATALWAHSGALDGLIPEEYGTRDPDTGKYRYIEPEKCDQCECH